MNILLINQSVGILDDMISYNVIYFDRKAVERNYLDHGIEIDTAFSYYDELRRSKNKLDPPDCLYPFFHLYNERACVFSEYFQINYNFCEDAIDSFLYKVKHSGTFKDFVLSYYLTDFNDKVSIDEIDRRDGESIAHALALLSRRVDVEHFTFMFYHFSSLVDTLITYLNQLRVQIESFHERHKKDTDRVIQEFISEDNQAMVRRFRSDCMSDLGKFEKQTYSVCYLNKFIIMRTYASNLKRYGFLLGCNCCLILLRPVDYRFMSATSALITLGHAIKLEILNELQIREMTISQLGRKLNLARTSISRYVEDLVSELVIIKAAKNGPEIYYRINPTYLHRAKFLINEYLDKLIVETSRRDST